MKKEAIFEIGGEGGSISISRVRTEENEYFFYHHTEFDPLDEDPDLCVEKEYTFDSFKEAFHLIDSKYPWHKLYIRTLHEDYKEYVKGRRMLKEKMENK